VVSFYVGRVVSFYVGIEVSFFAVYHCFLLWWTFSWPLVSLYVGPLVFLLGWTFSSF
jgi:hypothetical protein